MKKPYVAPTIEVYEYEVEHGYAQSAISDELIGDVTTESVEHGDDYSIGDDWHGEWY